MPDSRLQIRLYLGCAMYFMCLYEIKVNEIFLRTPSLGCDLIYQIYSILIDSKLYAQAKKLHEADYDFQF